MDEADEPSSRVRRSAAQMNYARNSAVHELKWTRILESRISLFAEDAIQRLHGSSVTIDWARRNGLRIPAIVAVPDGLGMKMPPSLNAHDVARLCGEETVIACLHAATQTTIDLTLKEYADYHSSLNHDRILNVITLAISDTELAELIARPSLVTASDWADIAWPHDADAKPKVSLYCLMGVKDCYTDFHVDFGGTSVFYHVLSGK